MREIEYGAYRLHTSDDMMSHYEPRKPWPERRKELLVQVFTRRKMFRELLKVWPVATGLEGYAILDAHGGHIDGQWVYHEGDRILGTIQSWIDSLDGSLAALMILACNPQKDTVTSQSSLVFHSNSAEMLPIMALHSEVISLYVPGVGYVEKDYKKLRRIINRLKDGLKKY